LPPVQILAGIPPLHHHPPHLALGGSAPAAAGLLRVTAGVDEAIEDRELRSEVHLVFVGDAAAVVRAASASTFVDSAVVGRNRFDGRYNVSVAVAAVSVS